MLNPIKKFKAAILHMNSNIRITDLEGGLELSVPASRSRIMWFIPSTHYRQINVENQCPGNHVCVTYQLFYSQEHCDDSYKLVQIYYTPHL